MTKNEIRDFHPLLCIFIVPEVFKSENRPKMAIFDLKRAIFDQKWNPRFSKIFLSKRQWQTVPVPVVSSTSMYFLWYLRSSKVKIVQKWLFLTWNGPFLTKNEIRDFRKYLYLNGRDKLCQYLKYHPLLCLFLWYLRSPKVKIVKNAYFWPEIGHFWPKIKSEIFKNIFI